MSRETTYCCSCFSTKWALLPTNQKVMRFSTITFVACAAIGTLLFGILIHHYGFHPFIQNKIGKIALITAPTTLLAVWGSVMIVARCQPSPLPSSKIEIIENNIPIESVKVNTENCEDFLRKLLTQDKIDFKDNCIIEKNIKEGKTINLIPFGHFIYQEHLQKDLEQIQNPKNLLSWLLIYIGEQTAPQSSNHNSWGPSQTAIKVQFSFLFPQKLPWDLVSSKNSLLDLCVLGNNAAGVELLLKAGHAPYLSQKAFEFLVNERKFDFLNLLIAQGGNFVIVSDSNEEPSTLIKRWPDLLSSLSYLDDEAFEIWVTSILLAAKDKELNNSDLKQVTRFKNDKNKPCMGSELYKILLIDKFYKKLSSDAQNQLKQQFPISTIRELQNIENEDEAIEFLKNPNNLKPLKSFDYLFTDNDFTAHEILKTLKNKNWIKAIQFFHETLQETTKIQFYQKGDVDLIHYLLTQNVVAIDINIALVENWIQRGATKLVATISEDQMRNLGYVKVLEYAYAKSSNVTNVFAALIQKIPIDSLECCFSIIEKAIKDKNTHVIKTILDAFNKYSLELDSFKQGEQLLHLAVEFSEPSIVKLIGDKMNDCSRQNNDGNTPLHLAASNSNEEIITALNGLKKLCGYNISNIKSKTPADIIKDSQMREEIKKLCWLVK